MEAKRDLDESEQQAALKRARALMADRRERIAKPGQWTSTLTIGALVFLGFLLTAIFDKDDQPARDYQPQTCSSEDAGCIGRKFISEIQAPCRNTLDAQLQQPANWSSSGWTRHFDDPAWYEPGESVIYYGNSATVRNAIGMELTPTYFCVVTVRGAVLKAEFRNLL